MSIPQLRVRTEHSFGRAYGPVETVARALTALNTPSAGIVDEGTWGHVRWAKALAKSGCKPLFGVEAALPLGDGRKPIAWALARALPGFYAVSTDLRRPEANLLEVFASEKARRSMIRFAGAALEDPECFDFVDLNPGSPLLARRSYNLAKHTGKPMVITSDNAYPSQSDRAAFLAHVDRQQVTPQHLLSDEEFKNAFAWLPLDDWHSALANTYAVAEECANELPKAGVIYVPEAEEFRTVVMECAYERVKTGRIFKWTPEYEQRLLKELEMIKEKAFESYFMVVADLVRWAKQHMLVGPARGSSAGSLVCFVLGITEVDPLKHNLLFERFIDVTRRDLPDIDIDFNDDKREMVFQYLSGKYGAERVARIGNINTLRPRSVMAKVCKKLGIPEHEKFDVLNVLIEYSSGDSRFGRGLEDTLANTDAGRKFAAKHPEAAIMGLLENHASHTGVHAAGVIVCNDAISHYCTVNPDGIAQIDKPSSEALGLLKIDALGLRTLGVIEDAGVVDARTLYSLPLDDPEVFRVFNEKRYAGIFQFEGQTQRMVASEIPITSFKQIDHCTALARPGPLGGGAAQHYTLRASGAEPVTFRHPSMAEYLGPTLGVVLYQEQVMRICYEIGKFNWSIVSEIRKAMSASKGKEYFDRRGDEFVAGAAENGVSEADARTIWAEICTFGAWGMNASHTVSYGIISYWCAWMKRYHPLEFAAANMRKAKDDEHALSILRDIVAEGVEYVAFDVDKSGLDWRAVDGKLVGGFMNLEGYGPAKAQKALEDRKAGRLDRDKIAKATVKFAELYPLRKEWKSLYDDPEAFGCAAGSVVLTADQFPERGNVLWLAKVVKKVTRDENETLRIARRNGKKMLGQTLFADIHCIDDSGTSVCLRIDRYDYERLGKMAVENLKADDVILVRGRRVPNFTMVKVDRIKCLNRPEALR